MLGKGVQKKNPFAIINLAEFFHSKGRFIGFDYILSDEREDCKQ